MSFFRFFTLGAGLALLTSGCRSLPPAALAGPTRMQLNELEYQTGSVPEGKVKLSNGLFETNLFNEPDTFFRLRLLPEPLALGDLNGDGVTDAAVILRSETRDGAFLTLGAVVSNIPFWGGDIFWHHTASKYLGAAPVTRLCIVNGRIEVQDETGPRVAYRLRKQRLFEEP